MHSIVATCSFRAGLEEAGAWAMAAGSVKSLHQTFPSFFTCFRRQCWLGAEQSVALQVGRRQSANVAASLAMRAGDNASQHSGDESPQGLRPSAPGSRAGTQQHAGGPAGGLDDEDDMHGKDLDSQDGDKDERRFRSARLQKRAQREGPSLT